MSEMDGMQAPGVGCDVGLPLSNIRALCPPIPPIAPEVVGTRRGYIWKILNESIVASVDRARALGAAVVDLYDQDSYEAEVRAGNPRAFVMYNNSFTARYLAHTRQAFFAGVGSNILRPEVASLGECDPADLFARLQAGEPFILAYPAIHRGHCKYLIQEPWQLKRVLRFCAANPGDNWPDFLEVREYIEGPSKRATHIRTLLTASGLLVAAVLRYSGHTLSSGKIIENDRLEESFGLARKLKLCLEDPDPDNPYFIASPDIRSNVLGSGGMIPLMGPALREPRSDFEVEVLHAHGLDPINLAVAADILEQDQLIANGYARYCDVLVGVDRLLRRSELTPFLLEINADPTPTADVVCGNSTTLPEAFFRTRLLAVESLSMLS